MKESHLTLQWNQRPINGSQTPRSYLDFYVSGRRLSELLGKPSADLVTGLGWGTPEEQSKTLAELLRRLPASLPNGLTPLHLCPECRGLDCGTIAVRIERDGKHILWRDFSYENGSTNGLLKMGPLRFEATDYWALFSSLARERLPRR
jgi:hypothetical protein